MAEWMYWMPLLAVPIVLLFRFVGCGKVLTVDTNETFSFNVTLDPVETTMKQGGSTDVKVKVTPSGNYNKEVTLEPLPNAKLTGWTFQWNPNNTSNKVTPTSGPVEALLTVKAPASLTTTEKLTLTIRGTGPGADPAQGPAGSPPPPKPPDIVSDGNLTINAVGTPAPPVPDFALTLGPTPQQVTRPNPATLTITLNRSNGFAEAVDLALFVNGTAQPGFGGFNPAQIPTAGTASTLTIPTGGASAGVYMVRVQGRAATSGAMRDSNIASLTLV